MANTWRIWSNAEFRVKILPTKLPCVLIIEPRVFPDSRGYFYENWNATKYFDKGLEVDFVQDNLSFSSKVVLRGLHFQKPIAQDKLISVLNGEVFDVALDLRLNSPTFAKRIEVELSDTNRR